MKISNDDQQHGYKDKNTNTSRSSSCSIDDSSSSSSVSSSSSQYSTAPPKFAGAGSSTNTITTPSSRSETLKKQSADQVGTPSTSFIQSEPLVDSSRQQQLHKGSMPLPSNKNHDVRITTKFQGEKDDVEREAQGKKGHEKIVSRTSEAGITSSTIPSSSNNHTRAGLTNLEEGGRQGGASTTTEELNQNCPSSPRKNSANATLQDKENKKQQQQTRKPSCDSSSGGIDKPETSYVDRAEELHLPASRGEQDLISFYLNGQVVGPFPLKLQTMLRLAEKLGMQDIIGWQPHGRSFCIRNPARFEAGLMKRFFKQKELASFRRQLNLYDFKRIKYGPDSGSYYHEMFLRGKPFHAYKMIRTKVKGTGGAIGNNSSSHGRLDNENEPNFYRMPFLPPCLNEYIASVSTDGSNSDTVAASLAAVGFGDVTAGAIGGGQTLMIPTSGVMSAPQQVGSDVFNAASSILSDHVRNQQHARQQQELQQQQQQQTISNAANLLPFFNVGLNQTFPSNSVNNNNNLYTSALKGQSQSHPASPFLTPESLLQHRNNLVNSDLRSYFLGGPATGAGTASLQPNSNISNILDMMLAYNQRPNIPSSSLSPIGHAMNNGCSNTNAGPVTSSLVGQMGFGIGSSSNNPMNFPNNLNTTRNDLLNLYNQLQYNNLNAGDRAWLEEGLTSSMIMGNSNHVRMPGNAVDASQNNSRDLFSSLNYNPASGSGGNTNQQMTVSPNLGFFLGTQMQAHGNTSQNTMANNLSASTMADNASTNPTTERAAINRHHQTTMQSESNLRIPTVTEQIENSNEQDHRTGN